MADTVQTREELVTALADNIIGAITPQVARNFLISVPMALIPTAVKTANYTAAEMDFVPGDTTGGAFTVSLLSAPADKTQVGVKLVAGDNPLTVACSGSDVIDVAGGATSAELTDLFEQVIYQYAAAPKIWYLMSVGGVGGSPGGSSGQVQVNDSGSFGVGSVPLNFDLTTGDILDQSAIAAIDPNGRVLYASDGTTDMIDWASNEALSLVPGGSIPVNFGGNVLVDEDQNVYSNTLITDEIEGSGGTIYMASPVYCYETLETNNIQMQSGSQLQLTGSTIQFGTGASLVDNGSSGVNLLTNGYTQNVLQTDANYNILLQGYDSGTAAGSVGFDDNGNPLVASSISGDATGSIVFDSYGNPQILNESGEIVLYVYGGSAVLGNSTVNTYIAGSAIIFKNGISSNIGANTFTASTFTSTIAQQGKTTKYNNVSTVGIGVPPIYAYNYLHAQTTAQSSVATFTPAGAGAFEVGGMLNVTARATDIIALECSYTDENSTAQTINLLSGVAATGNYPANTVMVYSKASSAITIKTVFTTGGGTMTYDVSAFIRQVG